MDEKKKEGGNGGMGRGMEGQLFPGMSDVSQHLDFLVYARFSDKNQLSVPGIHGVSNLK